MVDTDDTRRTTDDERQTTDDGRRTAPRVWHKLPTGELKISLSPKTYPDNQFKLRRGYKSSCAFGDVQLLQLTICKSIKPSTKYKSQQQVKPRKIRLKHDVIRSLSKFCTIQIFSLHPTLTVFPAI